MGLTLGQTNSDGFAAVEGCFMLFPRQGSHPPEARRSTRSRHAEWHCHCLCQPWCAVLRPLPVQGSRSSRVRRRCPRPTRPKERSSGAVHRWSLHLLSPAPLPPRSPAVPRGAEPPSLLPCFIPRHVVEKQSSAAQREDDGTTVKVERQASQPNLPPAAHGTRNLLIFYRKPGNIHMEISHFQSISTGFFPSPALHPVDHTASCFATAE